MPGVDARKTVVGRCLAALAAAGALCYANSLTGAFVLDDQSTIVDNPQIRSWSTALLPERNTAMAGRPLVNASFALNYAIGGLDGRGYHLVNILLHVACALLAFGVIRRTLDRLGEERLCSAAGAAFAAALLWEVHPLNTEVVDYLTERTESMMALFYLLAVYASVRALPPELAWDGHRAAGAREGMGAGRRRERGRRRAAAPPPAGGASRWWRTAAVAACAAGMACKESMATAPVMLALYDRVFAFRSFGEAFRRRGRFYAALAATWIVLIALNWSGPRAGVGGFGAGISVWTWALNQTRIIAHYLRLAVWPRGLVVFYGWPEPLTIRSVWPYAALVAALLSATVVALRRRPALGFLGAWFFITLAPTSSVVPIATEVGAERRMYLPLLACAVAAVVAAAAIRRACERRARAAAIGALLGSPLLPASALAAAAGVLAVGTMQRNREYASALTLARTVVERRPTPVAHHILAEQLSQVGRHEEAISELQQAVAGGDSRAGYLLGIELLRAGRLDLAARALEAFVGTASLPYRLVPRWLEPPIADVASARLALAQIAALQHRWPDALDQARRALALAPGEAQARLLAADALFGQARYAEAAAAYQDYLRAAPDDVHALANLGVAWIGEGALDPAIEVFRRATALEPGNASLHRLLAMALADRGDVNGAMAEAREAARLNPTDDEVKALVASLERPAAGH